MYYATVIKNGEFIVRRNAYEDFADAIESFSQYYSSRAPRSVLEFATQVVNGKLARSFTSLTLPESLSKADIGFKIRYSLAASQSNHFNYGHNFEFIVETEIGVQEAERFKGK